MYDEFFSKAYELLGQGQPFATAIVVRAEKPSSGKPGDKAIISPTGLMFGWIGGSCAQPTVIEQALQAMAEGEPRLIRLSLDPKPEQSRPGVVDLPMTCFSGGALEIYIEPQLPLPRLMVIGNLPVAQALIRLGRAMNYHVIAVDPDNHLAEVGAANEVITDLARLAGRITPLTYVVVASHGHFDELALEYVLRSQAAYVALVASKKRAAAVLAYLAGQGLPEATLARLKYPAGLDIQAVRGDEIALSIMAEIVQRRRNAAPLEVGQWLAGVDLAAGPSEATDPVCGMTVTIATAEHKAAFQEQLYYFCCAGCRESFSQNPGQYVETPPPAGQALDPVCGMRVDIATAKYMSDYGGQLYYFCAAGCKAAFDQTPQSYLAHAAS